MNRKRLYTAIIIVCSLFTFYHVYRSTIQGTAFVVDRSRSDDMNVKKNIFFLKTHKCGSSTVQNILLRFGYANSLDFVLPITKNYIGNPMTFSPEMIDESLRTSSGKYNIFAHHTRYDHANVTSVMFPDTIYITILRDPGTHFESIFNFYKLYKAFHVNLTDILNDEQIAKQRIDRGKYRKIGLNQMCWDLGMEPSDFDDPAKVKRFIEKIDRQFDLVMIMEYLESSLVLLADLVNWPLQSVTYLRQNSRPVVQQLTEQDKDKLRRLNSCDNRLYEYFSNKLKKTIATGFGLEKMKHRLRELISLNNSLEKRCVSKESNKGYAKTKAYVLRNDSDWQCVYSIKTELAFTEEVRQLQIKRLDIIRRLENFVRS